MWNPINQTDHEPPRVTATYQADGLSERIIVPGLRAAIVAIPGGLLAGLLIGAFELEVSVWYAIPIVTLALFLLTFWGGSQRGQWLVEKLTGADLNGDNWIGQPDPAPAQLPPLRIELTQEEGRRGDFIDLPFPEKLPALAAGLAAGRSFNQTAWTGHGAIFSRSEFDRLRDTLIERGLVAWKNPDAKAQGLELTPAGRAVFRRLATQTPTLPGRIDR